MKDFASRWKMSSGAPSSSYRLSWVWKVGHQKKKRGGNPVTEFPSSYQNAFPLFFFLLYFLFFRSLSPSSSFLTQESVDLIAGEASQSQSLLLDKRCHGDFTRSRRLKEEEEADWVQHVLRRWNVIRLDDYRPLFHGPLFSLLQHSPSSSLSERLSVNPCGPHHHRHHHRQHLNDPSSKSTPSPSTLF